MATLSFARLPANDATKAGHLAAPKRFFGDHSRYAVAPIHTRFDTLEWFVWDADDCDHAGKPEVIRQCDTLENALEGLA